MTKKNDEPSNVLSLMEFKMTKKNVVLYFDVEKSKKIKGFNNNIVNMKKQDNVVILNEEVRLLKESKKFINKIAEKDYNIFANAGRTIVENDTKDVIRNIDNAVLYGGGDEELMEKIKNILYSKEEKCPAIMDSMRLLLASSEEVSPNLLHLMVLENKKNVSNQDSVYIKLAQNPNTPPESLSTLINILPTLNNKGYIYYVLNRRLNTALDLCDPESKEPNS